MGAAAFLRIFWERVSGAVLASELRALNFAALIDYFWSTFGDARARWAGAAFDKSSAVYGHINENGRFVRKWPARKMPITDKMVKNVRLSVKIQPFLTRFYGQTLRKEASVRKSSS